MQKLCKALLFTYEVINNYEWTLCVYIIQSFSVDQTASESLCQHISLFQDVLSQQNHQLCSGSKLMFQTGTAITSNYGEVRDTFRGTGGYGIDILPPISVRVHRART